jgi:hypothetical protein
MLYKTMVDYKTTAVNDGLYVILFYYMNSQWDV